MAFGAYPGYGGYPQFQPGYPQAGNYPYMQQQYNQQPAQQMVQPAPDPQPYGGIIWVQGEAGAKSYIVASGNTVLLMDSEGNKFYLKSVDNAGMPSLRTFSYTEITGGKQPQNQVSGNQQQYVLLSDYQDALRRIAALEGILNKDGGENV